MTRKRRSLRQLGFVKVSEAQGITEYRLKKNGLKVLLKENHAAPAVNFMVAYKVGSRNEGAGNTGSAHYFEHLMFKGTKAFDPLEGNGPMEVFARVGAMINANTSRDITRYFECVPSEHLELCVRLEADRMRGLKNRQSDRDSEMTVVRNEFERSENEPDYVLYKEVCQAAFAAHPYHHPVIGFRTDVEGIPLRRMVSELYDLFYWPNNATAIVVGDFDSNQTLETIAKHFGRIPRSPQPIPEVYTVESPQEGERRVEVRRAGDLQRVLIAYHTPEARHADNYALSALAQVLGGDSRPTSRLYQALMETGLATECGAGHDEQRDPGLFMLSATLAPGTTFEAVETAIYAELDKLAKEPVDEAQLARIKTANLKGTVLQKDDPKVFTDMLSSGEGVADWKWVVEWDENFDAVTTADIQRVAGSYFSRENRTVGTFIPVETSTNETPASAAAPQVAAKAIEAKLRKQKRVKLAKAKARARIAPQVVRTVLPNGLTVAILPNRDTGSVAVNAAVYAGKYFGLDKPTVPSLTALMLTKGSQAFSKLQLGETIQEMGCRFGIGSDLFMSRLAQGPRSGSLMTKEDFPKFISVLAEVLQHPLFLADELAKAKKLVGAQLRSQMVDTGARGENALFQAIYAAGHPFSRRSFESALQEVETVTVGDLHAFHATHYSPKSTIITVVGDVDPSAALAEITAHFGQWSGPDRKPIVVTAQNAPASAQRIDVLLADKANVDILIGHPTALSRSSEDYFAATIANSALGADTISDRLGKEIRVRNGLSYGAYSAFGDAVYGAAPWTIELSVNPENVAKALELVNKVVQEYLHTGITAEELEDKIGQAIGSFTVRLRSNDGLSGTLCAYECIGLGAEGMDKLADGFRSVTKEAVDAAIQKYFTLDRSVTVLAGTLK